MMLSYRYRPNPMNNPRRGYGGYQTLYDQSASGVGGNLSDAAQQVLSRDPNQQQRPQ